MKFIVRYKDYHYESVQDSDLLSYKVQRMRVEEHRVDRPHRSSLSDFAKEVFKEGLGLGSEKIISPYCIVSVEEYKE